MLHLIFRTGWLLTLITTTAAAQSTRPATREAPSRAAERGELKGSVERSSVSHHQLELEQGVLAYRATAADMLLRDEAGKLKANMFFVAYELAERADQEEPERDPDTNADPPRRVPASAPAVADTQPESRPITFVFNGGPGAAAVWLHLGTAGPRRIQLGPDGFPPPPPFELADNHETWLTFTDMVFIDPVGTGFSRPAEGESAEQFYGVTKDIRWVSEFIRLYITLYRRWSSPVFLAGESYGTTRAAGLADHLIQRHGIAPNGIVLISSVLDFQTIRFTGGNDLPYIVYLPTYAAVAHYHNRLGEDAPELDALLAEVERWAITDYTVALARGDSLSPPERERIARRLARYTGLSADLILRSNLRISASTFQKHLLADRRQTVGRFDGRLTAFDLNPIAGWPQFDPSLSQYLPIYTSTFNDYIRRELNYESVLTYEVLSDQVRPWKFGEEGTGFLSVVDELRGAMARNPALRVMFVSGYYDMATPHFATWYTVNHLDLGPLQESIVERIYEGGHMMYHYAPARVGLHEDMEAFYRQAVPAR